MDRIRVYEYEIVHEFPHDPTAFTQVWFLVFSTHSRCANASSIQALSLSRTLSLSQACRIFSSSHERERSIGVCVCVSISEKRRKPSVCLDRHKNEEETKWDPDITRFEDMQGLVYNGNETFYESTGLYGKVASSSRSLCCNFINIICILHFSCIHNKVNPFLSISICFLLTPQHRMCVVLQSSVRKVDVTTGKVREMVWLCDIHVMYRGRKEVVSTTDRFPAAL
jgi:glutamine cyclotransferase